MRESSKCMTKSQADYEKWKDYFVDKECGVYICSLCKNNWNPNENDVNRKRPSTYYKLCSACRMKAFLKGRDYKKEKGNNYDKNRDG